MPRNHACVSSRPATGGSTLLGRSLGNISPQTPSAPRESTVFNTISPALEIMEELWGVDVDEALHPRFVMRSAQDFNTVSGGPSPADRRRAARRAEMRAAFGEPTCDMMTGVLCVLRSAIPRDRAIFALGYHLRGEAGPRVDHDLRALLALARSYIDAVPFREVQPHTLRLYADVCLLMALVQLVPRFEPTNESTEPLRSRKHARGPSDEKRCRACDGPLSNVRIRLKGAKPGLCMPCNAAAIKHARAHPENEAVPDEAAEPQVALASGAEARRSMEAREDETARTDGSSLATAPTTEHPAPAARPAAGTEVHRPVHRSDPRNPRAFDISLRTAYNYQPSHPRPHACSSDPWISFAPEGSRYIDAVKMLDLANIVAGGGDEQRLSLAAEINEKLQGLIVDSRPQNIPDFEPFDWPRRPSTSAAAVGEEDALDSAGDDVEEKTGLLCAREAIRELDQPPSLSAYASRESATPFVLRGYASNGTHHPRWRALDLWVSAAYLTSATGRGRVVPVELGSSYTEAGWGQALVGWQQFLSRAGWPDGQLDEDSQQQKEGEPVPVYMAQHALFRQFPALEGDFSVPDYVHSAPDRRSVPPGVDYVPPPETLVNAWIGSRGVLSPAHTDPYFNCYVQVLGRKRVWVAPPSVSKYMHAYGGDAPPADSVREGEYVLVDIEDDEKGEKGGIDEKEKETEDSDSEDEDESAFASLMTNTSRLPLLKPGQDAESILRQYPDFAEVLPSAREIVLEPGDMLVLPPGWWHAMRQEGDGPGWSISFWY